MFHRPIGQGLTGKFSTHQAYTRSMSYRPTYTSDLPFCFNAVGRYGPFGRLVGLFLPHPWKGNGCRVSVKTQPRRASFPRNWHSTSVSSRVECAHPRLGSATAPWHIYRAAITGDPWGRSFRARLAEMNALHSGSKSTQVMQGPEQS